MKKRKRYFDDYILYNIHTDSIWVGRPDTKTNNEPWRWYITNGKETLRTFGKPYAFVEIERQPEMSLFQ